MKRFKIGQVLSCFLLILGLFSGQHGFAQGKILFDGKFISVPGSEFHAYGGVGNRNYTFTFNSANAMTFATAPTPNLDVLDIVSASSGVPDTLNIVDRYGAQFDFKSLEFVPKSSAGFGTVLQFTAFRAGVQVAQVSIADIASGSLTKYPNPNVPSETFSDAFKNVDRVIITIPSGARFNHRFDNVVFDTDYDGDGVMFTQEVIDGTNVNSGCDFKLSSQNISQVSDAWKADDCDRDGISNLLETNGGTNNADFDFDGS